MEWEPSWPGANRALGYQLKDDAALALLLEQTAPPLHCPLDCLVLNYSSS